MWFFRSEHRCSLCECMCVFPTNGCDDSPSKEEGRAQVPQAAVVGHCSCRIYSWTDGGHNLLKSREKLKDSQSHRQQQNKVQLLKYKIRENKSMNININMIVYSLHQQME